MMNFIISLFFQKTFQTTRHTIILLFFHWSDWYHRPGGPAEFAERCPADTLGQSGPRDDQPTGSRRH